MHFIVRNYLSETETGGLIEPPGVCLWRCNTHKGWNLAWRQSVRFWMPVIEFDVDMSANSI